MITPNSCPRSIIVTELTSRRTSERMVSVLSGDRPGEHWAQRSRAAKTTSGFETLQIVTPSAVPRATAKQLRPEPDRAPRIANGWPVLTSFVPVTTWIDAPVKPRCSNFVATIFQDVGV